MNNTQEDAVTIQYCKKCRWYATRYPVDFEDGEPCQPAACHGPSICPWCESMNFGQRKAGFWGQFLSLYQRDF